MAWTDQDPEATDIILSARICINNGKDSARVEIDKLPDGLYRATAGNLFGSQEIFRSYDLERVLRAVEKARGDR